MSGNHILEVQNVTVSFDGFRVLDRLNFTMNYGELRFLIGPNGAGKTTLLDIITGKTKPHSGKVIFDGQLDLLHCAEHEVVRRGIGRKFQTPSVFPSLSVFENLETALGFKTATLRLTAPLKRHQHEKIMDTLEHIGLAARAQTRAGTLSHGEKQWLEIGMLLVQDPKLLLLDEPVAGMTRRERDRTGELLQDIARNRSVLVVEHDMVFVRQFGTVITVLHMGQLLCEAPMEKVQSDPKVIQVYLGRSHKPAKVAV